MNRGILEHLGVSSFVLAVATGCGDVAPGQPEEVAEASEAVIENTEDWDWIGLHTVATDAAFNLFAAGDARNSLTAANGVASLSGGCDGFLISRDQIATADHCFRSTTGVLSAISVTATFFA